MEYKIPLRNKDKKIIDYCLVSQEDFEHLNQFKWNKKYDGYVTGYIHKFWRIHRYIMIEILKNNITSKVKIDHINNNPLDNRRENLRIITNSGNNRNKVKISTGSKYYGVTWNKLNKKWCCQISVEQKNLWAFYINEEDAAWHYNLWIEEYNLEFAKKNTITKPKDFIKWEPLEKKGENLPKGIYFEKERFSVKVNVNKKEKRFGTYDTLEEAIKVRTAKLKELEEINNKNLLTKPILKNKNRQAIIELFNKKKEKTSETIVDENIYYDLMKYNWYLNNHGYVIGRGEDKKLVLLHRYIMKYYGDDFIDHINNNPLDNRKENLRILNAQQNSQNKVSNKTSTSKYVGVSFNTKNKKWVATISVNNKKIHLGSFNDEIEAAKTRDIATKEHYAEFGNYNFADE
jgi:hypothetical protein